MKILLDKISNTKFLVKEEEAFHTKWGTISKAQLQKKTPRSNKGREFFCFPPTFSDKYRKIKRGAQLTPLEVLGRIAIETGISKESIVVDAGTGSGAAACYFAHLVKKTYSFDNVKEHVAMGKDNARFLNLNNIIFKQSDVYIKGFEGIKKESVDLVFIDLPEPHRMIVHAAKVLAAGGFFVVVCPQMTQIIKFKEELDKHERKKKKSKNYLFADFKMIEIIERLWKIEKDIARPAFNTLGHNGFVAVMRKI